MVATAVFGLALARVFFSPIHHKGAIPLLLTSVGVGFMLRNGIRILLGPQEQHISPIAGTHRFDALGGFFVSNQMLVTIGLALAAFAAMHLLLSRTKLGMAMRATGDDEALARSSGVDTGRIRIYVWLLASALAGLSGYVLALQQSASPTLGLGAILLVITAAILGGAGNPYGAIVGAYIIGISTTLATGVFLPGLLSGLGTAVAFVILIAILLVRPGGITGEEVGA
jgi:branched-subunit amino acid ABC-type transport system permease component